MKSDQGNAAAAGTAAGRIEIGTQVGSTAGIHERFVFGVLCYFCHFCRTSVGSSESERKCKDYASFQHIGEKLDRLEGKDRWKRLGLRSTLKISLHLPGECLVPDSRPFMTIVIIYIYKII